MIDEKVKEFLSQNGKKWSSKLSKEELSARMSKIAKDRWAKVTPEERKAHSEKMILRLKKKYADKN